MKLGYTVLLIIYILMSLLVPLASYNKMLFVALVLVYGGYLLGVKKEKIFDCLKSTLAPVGIIAIFAYGFLAGLGNGADLALAKQFLLATSMFVLIYPIEEFDIDMNGVLKIVARVYIVFFAIYVIYAMNVKEFDIPVFLQKLVHALDNDITRTVGSTLHQFGSGLMTHRTFFGGGGMQIYIGSTPFMLVLTDILFVDFLRNKKVSNLFFVLLSVLLTLTTGSRTLMLLVPASLCILIWAGLDRKKQIIVAAIIAAAGAAAFTYLLTYSNFFSLEERSNFVKVGHIISYFEQLDTKNALLGDGLASFYYSSGVEYDLAHTEITLMDHCRYFGIPLGISVWFMLIVPKVQKGWKNWKNWKIWEMKEELLIFLLYLVFAQTNPVLFNSFGLTVVLWYWNSLFMKYKKENNV